MKLIPPYRYLRPKNLQEAVEQLGRYGEEAKILAGGTDLIPMIRDCLITPKTMIDISFLDELRYIREEGDMIKIGALTTHSEILKSPLINGKTGVLAKAEKVLGATQIRNRGTIGGNLCNASPAADTAPPLMVLNAKLKAISVEGERIIPIEEFFTGPRKNALKPNEILVEVQVSPEPEKSGSSFIKLGRRRALTLSVVSTAALIVMDGVKCRDARIALGAVAPTPVRAKETEKLLINKELNGEVISSAAEKVVEEINPITDIRGSAEYRKEMSKVLTKRCLLEALESVKR